MTPLRVAIDARLAAGVSGGIEQFVIGLASALGRLDDGDEEYLFLVHPDQHDWLTPYVKGSQRLLPTKMEYPGQPGHMRMLRRELRWRSPFGSRRGLGHSDATIERAGAEVVHFPTQEAFLTDVPSIYHPHDLQHLHLPDLFSEAERDRREFTYRRFCKQAELVVMMSSWGRRDLLEQYGLPPEKVAVVNWGSVVGEYPAPTEADLQRLRARLSLPERFLLYPAQTWPHKNHLRLLEALALLRDRHQLRIPVVNPGRQTDFYAEIEAQVRRLGLGDTVSFPGFLSAAELRGLYVLADGLVFPSRFEGWGMPICEAFSSRIPVASSSATGLPELVGDAGLLFDPDQPEQIAEAIRRLWDDAELRRTLVERGNARAETFSIDRAARLFRAHYRRLAKRRLSDEDRILLETPPLA